MPTLRAQLHQLPHTQQSPIPGEIETGTGLGDEMEEILNSWTDPWTPERRLAGQLFVFPFNAIL